MKLDKEFLYTQSSLETYLSCAYKFKLRYLQGVYWAEDAETKESLKKGNDFHLIAERYFRGIKEKNYGIDEELKEDLENLKNKYPLKENWKYYPELEIREKNEEIKLLGRYDLIIVKPGNKVVIVDFKTNKLKLDLKKLETKLQTIVYMYLLWENYQLIGLGSKKIRGLEMIYYQTTYPKENFVIKYNQEIHENNKKIIKKIIKKIKEENFSSPLKTRCNHCVVCELQKKCW